MPQPKKYIGSSSICHPLIAVRGFNSSLPDLGNRGEADTPQVCLYEIEPAQAGGKLLYSASLAG